MSTFIGALLDVSGSMKNNIGDGVDEEGGTWARSVFTVIDDLIKHDVSDTNRVFAVGFGARKGRNVFDILGTIREVQIHQSTGRGPAKYQTIEKVLQILELNGAPTIRKWAEIETIRRAVFEHEAQLILKTIESDKLCTRWFVDNNLPRACFDWEVPPDVPRVGGAFASPQDEYASAATSFVQATTDDIEEVVRKAITSIKQGHWQCPAKYQTVKEILHKLESNGAQKIRQWAEIETIRRALSEKEAQIILEKITFDYQYAREFVNYNLPRICLGWKVPREVPRVGEAFASPQDEYASAASSFVQATTKDIKDVVRKAMTSIVPAEYQTIEEVLNILESNGARTIRKWAEKDTIRRAVYKNEAQLILEKITSDKLCTRWFVDNYLPRACFDWEEPRELPREGGAFASPQDEYESAASSFVQATTTDIKDVVRKAMTSMKQGQCPAEHQTIEEVLNILESNGARTIRKWAEIDTMRQAVAEHEAQFILKKIASDKLYARWFVDNYLPRACFDWEEPQEVPREGGAIASPQDEYASAATSFVQATTKDIKEVVRKAITSMNQGQFPAEHQTIEEVLQILDSNGARTIRKWAEIDTIRWVVSENVAQLILKKIASDKLCTRMFVDNCLPRACRDLGDAFVQATTTDIKEVVRKAMTSMKQGQCPAEHQTIEEVLRILESKGARTIRKWAEINTIRLAVAENEAQLIRKKLTSDEEFARYFVNDCLPNACRDFVVPNPPVGGFLISWPLAFVQSLYSSAATSFVQAKKEDVEEVVGKSLMRDVSERSVFKVQDAANIIRGCVDERELTTQRARELLKIVEPFIYGYTPLYSALRAAAGLLERSMKTHPNHHRLLFIMSDGYPSDGGSDKSCISGIKRQLEKAKVTVVSCYICSSSSVEPRRLYSVVDEDWEKGAKFLFDLSSKIPTEFVTRAIFIKHGWQIEITNNETKLFLHVNHPDHLKDACSLAQNAVCCLDSLSDLLVSVDLDIYINLKNADFTAQTQVGSTCYANASAAVLHLAMHRILGRDGGYPDFEKIRDEMIDRYGKEGAIILCVLQEVCPRYRLHCQQVDVNGAREAIAAKRPVVATFLLTDEEWDTFARFYLNNPTGILKKRDLDISKRRPNAKLEGHAVVLTSFNSECLRLMNSWGDSWGDIGFFRVENAEVLDLEFFDVYWTLDDLSRREKDYYRMHGSEVAEKLMKSLKGLQVSVFTCPSCRQTSKVIEFSGTLSRARCPECKDEFSCQDGDGNILALNIYLTSLSRKTSRENEGI